MVKVADLKVGSIVSTQVLNKHDFVDIKTGPDVVLEAAKERRLVTELNPVEFVPDANTCFSDANDAIVVKVSWVLELNDVEIVFEFDVDQLVTIPEFRVDFLVELNDVLVVLSLCHIGGLDKQRNPVITAIRIKVSGQEVVAVDIVATLLVNKDHNVDLVAAINKVFLALVHKSNKSTSLVQS